MIVDHFTNPATFNWTTVNVRAWEYERAIQQPELIAEGQLSTRQRQEQFDREKGYKEMFTQLRPELEKIFVARGEARPRTFRQAIARLQSGEGNLIWATGKWLYDRAAETDTSEAAIKEFMEICPPFRAVIYAVLMSWYDIALRDKTGEKFTAGRNDLFMSAHLPYCDKFVTAEKKREQERCLREVAAIAGLKTEILSYDDFCDSFLVTA